MNVHVFVTPVEAVPCLNEFWSLAFFYGHIYMQQQASLFISIPVFRPNFVVIMQYCRILQQLCRGLTSSGMWHCVTGVGVSWCYQRLTACETSGNTNQQTIVTLLYSLVFMVLNQVVLTVYLPLYVWYPSAVLIINHFCLYDAILAYMKNRKFKCGVAIWLSSHHCMGLHWCSVK
jgi:hypothetical protein